MPKVQGDGSILARVQLATAERDGKGRIKRVERRKIFPSNKFKAAEAWEKRERERHSKVGVDNTLSSRQATEYFEAKGLVGGKDLREVARFYAERNLDKGSKRVEEVIREFYQSEKWAAYAPSTRSTNSSILGKFGRKFGKLNMADLTVKDVDAYLRGFEHEVTRNNHRRVLKHLIKWAMQSKQGFVRHFRIEDLGSTQEDFGTPEFYTVEETARLFQAAVKTDTGMIPFLALGHFAGLRPSEITRLQARDFNFEEKWINVRAEVAKRRRKGKPLPRLIEGLPDTLWKWLGSVGFQGAIDTANYVKRRANLYKLAGLREINSGARHTFSTYSYAYTQNSGLCKKWTGHRGGDSLFLTRYAGLEKKVRGESYFQILPPSEIPMVRVTTKFGKRADWPSDEELLTWAERSTKVAIAKWLGVSDVAVHKRLRKIREG